MKSILIASLLLSLISCATQSTHSDLDTVDVSSGTGNDLKINEKNSSGYGPSIEIDEESRAIKKAREPIVAVVNFSTLYHSLGLVSELKKIESENIKVSVISSYGFGGVIAALYAKERSVSYVEWKLFSLSKKLSSHKIYSEEWTQELTVFLKDEFKDLKTNQLAIQLIVPTLSLGEVVYEQQVGVASVLIESLLMQKENSFFRSPQNFDLKLERDFSLDFIYKTSYLPVTPTITKLNSLQYGLYTSYLGKLLAQPEQFGLLKAPVKQEIDEISLISELENLYEALIDERTQKFKSKIEKWKEESINL